MLTAIRNAPRHKDVTDLKSFLGRIMFYSRFMPTTHSTVHAPLHNLLMKDTPWKWSKLEEDAFVASEELIINHKHWCIMIPSCLSIFFMMLHLMVLVLSHQMNGQFRHVPFISCTSAQKNYSQLEQEVFSILFLFWIETVPPVPLWSVVYNFN